MFNEKQKQERAKLKKAVVALWVLRSEHSDDSNECEDLGLCPGWILVDVRDWWEWEVQRCDQCNGKVSDLLLVREVVQDLRFLNIGTKLVLEKYLYPASAFPRGLRDNETLAVDRMVVSEGVGVCVAKDGDEKITVEHMVVTGGVGIVLE